MNACQQKCASCGRTNNFEFPFYVNDLAWPDFITQALENIFGGFECEYCKEYICATQPFIFDSSHLQLLVFIVHKHEYGAEIESIFKSYLEEACKYLPGTLVQGIKKKPYTFVRSCHGWLTFLKYIQNVEVDAPELDEQPPGQRDSSLSAITMTFGYIYRKLFFYYPDEFSLRFAAQSFINVAEQYSFEGQYELAYAVLTEATKTICVTHQWLIQKLGEVALRLGKFEEAKVWLSKAVSLQHKWLAPTISFLDATPPRRGEDTQDNPLLQTVPAFTQGNVTASRHVLSYVFPPRRDYDLWYFPELLQRVEPTLDKLLIAYAVALGEVEYSHYHYHGNLTLSVYDPRYNDAYDAFIYYMRQAYNLNLSKIIEQSWFEYVLRCWGISQDFMITAASEDPEQRSNLSERLGNVMGHLHKALVELERDRSKMAYLLRKSLDTLFSFSQKFIESCPREEQRELMRIRFQTELDVLNGKGRLKVSIIDGPPFWRARAEGTINPRSEQGEPEENRVWLNWSIQPL